MTPERWRRIGDLFERALEVDPPERDRWLATACGDDHELSLQVTRLLEDDERARRDGFLVPPQPNSRAQQPVPVAGGSVVLPSVSTLVADGLQSASSSARREFAPRAAISADLAPHSLAEAELLVRERLRELLSVYLVIFTIRTAYGFAVHLFTGLSVPVFHALTLLVLAAVLSELWGRRPFSLAAPRRLELGIVALLACLGTYTEYYNMRFFSLNGEPMTAWSSLKNNVLVTAIFILTFGLYVPKSWRRAAVVGAVLATMPFLTLMLVYQAHRPEMAWLTSTWMSRRSDAAGALGL